MEDIFNKVLASGNGFWSHPLGAPLPPPVSNEEESRDITTTDVAASKVPSKSEENTEDLLKVVIQIIQLDDIAVFSGTPLITNMKFSSLSNEKHAIIENYSFVAIDGSVEITGKKLAFDNQDLCCKVLKRIHSNQMVYLQLLKICIMYWNFLTLS